MAEKSPILIIGGTGGIGKFIVEESLKSGHRTFALVRKTTISNPVKGKLIHRFQNSGATILTEGDLYDHRSLVDAVKQVDVVISAVGHNQWGDQDKIIAAITDAGNVKRFIPSEFGNDVDRPRAVETAVEPAKTVYATKAKIRRAIEARGIPYTYVVAFNFFSSYSLTSLSQLNATAMPRDEVTIFGNGNAKVVFNDDRNIATYIIKAVDDPRTLNKILYIRLHENTFSFNGLVSLWEKKIGKTLEKEYISEEQLSKQIQECPVPFDVFFMSIWHSIYVKGMQTYFDNEPCFGVEASELYPEVKYTTVDEYLNQFV